MPPSLNRQPYLDPSSVSVSGEDASNRITPEEQLGCAVINRAINDLFKTKRDRNGAVSVSGVNSGANFSLRFLTDEVGAWRESRYLWSDVAGVNPEVVRDAVVALLHRLGMTPKEADQRMMVRDEKARAKNFNHHNAYR